MKKVFLLFLSTIIYAKILIVNSYSTKDQCGIPQLNGFLSVMYSHGYRPSDFDIVFLNSRVTSKEKLIKKAKNILKNIKNYKFIVTFDDIAFKLVGIPASKKGKWVYFSGVNYPYDLYEKEYNLPKNIAGIYEKLFIYELFKTFDKIKKIKKIAFIYSKGVGEIVKIQLKREVKDTKFEKMIDYLEVNNIKDLKNLLVKINKKYTLFMPFALSLKNKNKKLAFLDFKDIYLKYLKLPDISFNPNFAKFGFLGFGGVDFFEMGVQLGKLVIFHKKRHIIEDAKYFEYFINTKRAREINFVLPKWFIRKVSKFY